MSKLSLCSCEQIKLLFQAMFPNYDSLLYADDSCLLFRHKDVKEIERVLNINFSKLCDWFVDNKLSVHFGEDKTKCILFSSKIKAFNASPLNINYKGTPIKQYTSVKYLGCLLDNTLSGQSMGAYVSQCQVKIPLSKTEIFVQAP